MTLVKKKQKKNLLIKKYISKVHTTAHNNQESKN